MPMYTFDPADDEARWEADLLEDDREQQIALNVGDTYVNYSGCLVTKLLTCVREWNGTNVIDALEFRYSVCALCYHV
jgi:hypothetical protein